MLQKPAVSPAHRKVVTALRSRLARRLGTWPAIGATSGGILVIGGTGDWRDSAVGVAGEVAVEAEVAGEVVEVVEVKGVVRS